MVYLKPKAIKNRIEQDPEDFFDANPEIDFDSLLETLEEETRSMIESYKGDVTFAQETKEERFRAPDNSSINLLFPVNSVTKIEYRTNPGDAWETLDSKFYSVYPRKVVLRKSYGNLMRGRYMTYNPISWKQKRRTWADFCTDVKITYDRGYSTIPSNVKNVQITMINKILRQLRNEQSITALQPDEVNNYVDFDEILTDELKERLDSITSFRTQVTVA